MGNAHSGNNLNSSSSSNDDYTVSESCQKLFCVGGNVHGCFEKLPCDSKVIAKIAEINKDRSFCSKILNRDLRLTSLLTEMCMEITGFQIEFESIALREPVVNPPVVYSASDRTAIKIVLVLPQNKAQLRVCSIRGFYALASLIHDLWDHVIEEQVAINQNLCERIKVNNGNESSHAIIKSSHGIEDHCSHIQDPHQNNGRCDVNEGWQQDIECPICMNENSDIVQSCGHAICRKCFLDWHYLHSNCPVCRFEGSKSEKQIVKFGSGVNSVKQRLRELLKSIVTLLDSFPQLMTSSEKDEMEMSESVNVHNKESMTATASDCTKPAKQRSASFIRAKLSDLSSYLLELPSGHGSRNDAAQFYLLHRQNNQRSKWGNWRRPPQKMCEGVLAKH